MKAFPSPFSPGLPCRSAQREGGPSPHSCVAGRGRNATGGAEHIPATTTGGPSSASGRARLALCRKLCRNLCRVAKHRNKGSLLACQLTIRCQWLHYVPIRGWPSGNGIPRETAKPISGSWKELRTYER